MNKLHKSGEIIYPHAFIQPKPQIFYGRQGDDEQGHDERQARCRGGDVTSTPALTPTLAPTPTLQAALTAGTTFDIATVPVLPLSGTNTLTADFGAATLSTNMTFSGTPIESSSQLVSGVPLTTVSGTGSIGSPGYRNTLSTGGDADTFHGTFDGGTSGSGTFTGRFHDPNAQEFGYHFSVTAGHVTVAGIAIGKR